MALVTRIFTSLLLISEISSLRFEPHTGEGMIFLSKQNSFIQNSAKEDVFKTLCKEKLTLKPRPLTPFCRTVSFWERWSTGFPKFQPIEIHSTASSNIIG